MIQSRAYSSHKDLNTEKSNRRDMDQVKIYGKIIRELADGRQTFGEQNQMISYQKAKDKKLY